MAAEGHQQRMDMQVSLVQAKVSLAPIYRTEKMRSQGRRACAAAQAWPLDGGGAPDRERFRRTCPVCAQSVTEGQARSRRVAGMHR